MSTQLDKPSNPMLTTVDNPYNPFTNFDQWYMFDVENRHNSCGQLATFAMITDSMSDDEAIAEMERAVDDIIANDPLNIYTKIYIDGSVGQRKIINS